MAAPRRRRRRRPAPWRRRRAEPPARRQFRPICGQIANAKSGDVHIAYQVNGEGPIDLVFVPGFVSHVEYVWEHPRVAQFFRRLISFSRLIHLDKRGSGLSDRVADIPTLEQRMDDVRAVMDAVGSERAALFGVSEGGPMSLLFSATYPERTSALVLYGSYARLRSEADRWLAFARRSCSLQRKASQG